MRVNPALIVVPALMIGLLLVMASPGLMARPVMPYAVAADLVLTLPLVLIALSWRRGRPAGSLPLVVLLSAVAATALLPPPLSGVMVWVAAGAGMAFVAAMIGYVAKRMNPRDPVRLFHDRLPAGIGGGWMGRAVAGTLATLIYAISPPHTEGPIVFSSHRTSGARAFYGALIAVIALETVPVHIGLHLLSPIIAWLVTGSSILMGVAILGHVRGLGQVGHRVEDGVLRLRSGCAYHTAVPIGAITDLRPFADDDAATPLAYLPPLERPNLIVELDRDVPVYLGQRPVLMSRRIAFHVDDVGGLSGAVCCERAD